VATEDPWDAPDPKKLRITSAPATRPVRRPTPQQKRSASPAPPPHHASPRPEHGVIDEAAVEAPPIPRPEQPEAPRPAMIDTRVSQGQTPVPMAVGLEGASWRDVDEHPGVPQPPPVRPWARRAGLFIGGVAMLTIFGLIFYVLVIGAMRALEEMDSNRADGVEIEDEVDGPAPAPEPTFREPAETTILDDEEAPTPEPDELDGYDDP